MMAGRYAHAKQFKRHHRQLRLLRTRLGRLIRDYPPGVPGGSHMRFPGSVPDPRILFLFSADAGTKPATANAAISLNARLLMLAMRKLFGFRCSAPGRPPSTSY